MRARPVLPALVLAVALLATACSGPGTGGGGDGGQPTPPPAADLPAWYGTDLDGNGCPVPASGAEIDVFPDAAAFLQTDVPAGWCMYSTIDYLEYYAIPAVPSDSFGADVRAALEPAGWEFDAADDDSPQWSWISTAPAGAEEGFEDGYVDGAIFLVDSATADDLDTYQIWFMSLIHAFGGEWSTGDRIQVLGFW
jgi:hypothetical protein